MSRPALNNTINTKISDNITRDITPQKTREVLFAVADYAEELLIGTNFNHTLYFESVAEKASIMRMADWKVNSIDNPFGVEFIVKINGVIYFDHTGKTGAQSKVNGALSGSPGEVSVEITDPKGETKVLLRLKCEEA